MRALLPALAVVLGVAAILRLGFDQYLNYDARYALLWARDLYNGVTPDYTADFAPTPHPLETWVSVLAVPFGDSADALMIWIILLCFGLLVWLTYRLGATLFHPAVGIVTALVVATRPALFRDALIGYQDTAFACAIVGAVLLEAKRPRRGEVVMGLLVLAGLMRPEGWALGGLYALWMFPACAWPRRIRLLAMAGVAPVLWAAMDWYVTGDPLHSLHGTADLAEAVDRRREPEQAPFWTLQYFGYVLREPIVAGLPVGLFFAWRFRLRAAILPLVVVAVMIAVFMIGPFFGLPLIGRYVRTPSVLLALFYGLAVAGWLLLDPGRRRRLWMWIGIAVGTLSLLWLPWHVGMVADTRRNLDQRARAYESLRDVARQAGPARAVDACGGTVSAAEHRILPHLRWWMDLPPDAVTTVEAGVSPLQPVLVTPRDTRAMRRFYRDQFPRPDIPTTYAAAGGNRNWSVRVDAGCAP
ncbi:MAG TPA: hypothetical protein VD836_17555 [Solirubrobacteraceae bacterium]|nr:hypothetical protein [Solirubrobacteraceae bacterium]